MIVSEAHNYVFIQFPQAASTAIAKELVEHYDGQPILRKHSNYHHFRSWAGAEAERYFVFSSVRNPLEKQVTLYHKFRSNHLGHFTDPSTWRKNGGWLSRRELRRYRYVCEKDASFEEFFLRFFWLPFVDWSVLAHKEMDFVIRFEALQEGFSTALRMIGLEQVRPLPAGNRTRKEGRGKESYYPAAIGRRATWVMGPMLEYWDYPIPEEWGDHRVRLGVAKRVFPLVAAAKKVYYNHMW